jgi:hypothetical protein
MNLAGLRGNPRKGLGHREDQGFFLVAHDPPQAQAQGRDGMGQAGGYGAVSGREQRRGVEHQASDEGILVLAVPPAAVVDTV